MFNVLRLQSVSKQFGAKVLFQSAEATLGSRSRVALIGPNGSGKSTLIKMVIGEDYPDSGEIIRAKHLAIGYLSQEIPRFGDRSVLSEVLRMDGRREELSQARQEMEAEFAQVGDQVEEDQLERYGRILEELDQLDQYRLEPRAKEILMGVGFKPGDFDRPLTALSGGWLMRVALSRILLMDPDVLLLDEPTNHLDLESLLWLEEFLRSFRGALLVVSHDTEFLNRMVTEVWEIDQKRVNLYRGNLDAYAVQKEERLEVLRAQYEGQQAKIAEMQAFIDRFRAKATKARQAQSRIKQLEKMEKIELPEERSTVRFRFPPAPHSGREVVTLKNATFCYGEKTIFRGLNWVIQRGSRVAIVGVNGAGKTTLLKLLSGKVRPEQGEVRMGHEVRTGYYAQIQAESLDPNKTILQELEQTAPDLPVSRVRGIAGAFLFSGDAVEKKCAVLSGGEKARVALAKLLLSPSNFLLLDEPTNHLDVESRGVLLDALKDYEGTLCLVSHDRAFMAPLVDHVLEIQPAAGGTPSATTASGSAVVQLPGSYDDYLERKTREIVESVRERRDPKNVAAESASTAVRKGPSNNQRRAWERERDQLERDIERLESEKRETEGFLADLSTYEDKTKTLLLIEKQREIEQSLSAKLSRWEEICLMIDSC